MTGRIVTSTTKGSRTDPVRGIEMPVSVEAVRRATPRFAQQATRFAVRAYGTRTAKRRRLPDYLIIGAKKGGTSSLTNWLLQHPDVKRMYPPFQRLKSAHYFDVNYHRGQAWYRGHFPRRPRSKPATSVVGEASPYYLFHPAAPQRAHATVPTARVIAVLRDPVSRAHSNYWDRVAAGQERLPTFEAALEAESDRLATVDEQRLLKDPYYYSTHHDHHSYRARGLYLEQLRRWYAVFTDEQIMVVHAEHMYAEPATVFAAVEDFLGIPHCTTVDFRTYNQRTNPPLDPQTRHSLAEFYRPHNEALYGFLDRDLHWEARHG